ESPCRPASSYPALEAAVGLEGEVLEEQRIHRALEADVQLADLSLRQREKLDAAEGERLEEGRDVGLVTRQPIETLGNHPAEAASTGLLQQRLVARPQRGCTGDGVVCEGDHIGPALSLDFGPAVADLILDRGLALLLARIAGIDDCAHGAPHGWRGKS